MTVRNMINGMRHGEWLTREWVVGVGWLLLLAELTFLIMLALFQHGVTTPIESSTSSDFVSFYAAGKLVLAGTPALVYDQAAHLAMEQRFMVEGAPYQFFFYPPMFLLLCAPLALMPYFLAFYVFEIATLIAFLQVMRSILREPSWTWFGPVLAFPAIFWTLGLGQNAFLTAALFGGFTLLVDRKPVLAGMLLGLLCYKPHFGLLVPAALAFGGYWRAFFSAAVTMVMLTLLTAGTFGTETWHAWWLAFTGSNSVYAGGLIDYAGIVTPFGAARLLGFNPSASYGVQAFITFSMALLVALVWRAERRLPARAAALMAATLLAVPLVLLYDKLLLLVAIAWLVRDGRQRGFLKWEKTVLVAVYPVSIATYVVGAAWHLPVGPLISFTVLALTLRRVGQVSRSRRRLRPAGRPVPEGQLAAPSAA